MEEFHAGLVRQIVQKAAVSCRERLAWNAWAQHQRPHTRSLVGQRQTEGLTAGYANRGGDFESAFVLETQCRVRQFECLRHGLDDGRQHGLWRQARAEALAESGQHGVWLVALAVKQPVDNTLHPFT